MQGKYTLNTAETAPIPHSTTRSTGLRGSTPVLKTLIVFVFSFFTQRYAATRTPVAGLRPAHRQAQGRVLVGMRVMFVSDKLIGCNSARLMLEQRADKFLGLQGDPYGTRPDMFFARFGDVCARLTLSRWQATQLEGLW